MNDTSASIDRGDGCGIRGAVDPADENRTAGALSRECAPAPVDQRIADDPIACTLGGTDMRTRLDEYRAVFLRIVDAERYEGGFAWRFPWDPNLDVQVRSLVAKEQDCCRFLRFNIRRDGEHIVWETRAADPAAAVLEEFFHLPERLIQGTTPNHGVKAVKLALERAGLVFSPDAGERRA